MAFDVDISTGHLMYDDSVPPYTMTADLVHNEENLLVNGYGVYSISDGNVMVEGSPFLQPDRRVRAKAWIYVSSIDWEFQRVVMATSDDIVSFVIDTDIGSSPIGATPSAKLTITLSNENFNPDVMRDEGYYYNDAEIWPYLWALDDNDIMETKPLGRFVVLEYNESSPTITFTCVDYMTAKMQKKFVDPWVSGDYPLAYYKISDMATEQCGVPGDIFDDSTNTIPSVPTWPDGCTCRDVIGWVAALVGGFAYIDNYGICKIRKLSTLPDIEVDASQYFKLSRYSNYININVQTLVTEDGGTDPVEMLYAPVANAPYYKLEYSGNPLLKSGWAENTNVYDRWDYYIMALVDRQNAKLTWNGGADVVIGDTIQVTRPDNNVSRITVLQHRLAYNGGLKCESGCGMSSYTIQQYLS